MLVNGWCLVGAAPTVEQHLLPEAVRQRRLTRTNLDEVAFAGAFVQLSWAANLVRACNHLIPVRDPSWRASCGENDGKHCDRDADRLKRDA